MRFTTVLTWILYHEKGDSRAILQRSSDGSTSVISLSNDHKPNNVDEVLRIRNAGGEVIRGLIEGRLAVSRGLGDFSFKHTPSVLCALDITVHCSSMDDYVLPENQMVTPVPEIMFYNRVATSDKFITIASDGIWDVLSNDKCAEIISKIFDEGEQRTALVCEEVLDQCYAKGSLDNMTLVLIKFPAQNIGIGGGVLKRRKQRLRNW
jgi:serine/threonine protein phosphatase PrpC